jgi:tyrosinase
MAAVVRKDFRNLSSTEKTRIVNAFLRLKSHDVSTNTVSTTGGTYQKYVSWHQNSAEHRTTSFLAWHRAFLWELEEDLIKADLDLSNDGNIGIPYWKWEENDGLPGRRRGRLWSPTLLGGNGVPANSNQINTGSFVKPAWTIFDVNTLTARAEGLMRDLGGSSSSMPTARNISRVLRVKKFDLSPYDDSSPTPTIDPVAEPDANMRVSFRNILEGWYVITPGSTNLHNNAHVWIGGDMSPFTSPNDPAFFFNHAYVDLLWAQWQFRNPTLIAQNPTDAEINAFGQRSGGQPTKSNMPRKMDDIMTPWDGTLGTHSWRVRDTYNFQTMGNIGVQPLPAGVFGPPSPGHDYAYDIISRRTLTLT